MGDDGILNNVPCSQFVSTARTSTGFNLHHPHTIRSSHNQPQELLSECCIYNRLSRILRVSEEAEECVSHRYAASFPLL